MNDTEAATNALCAFLASENPIPAGWTYKVYLWDKELRISELGASGPTPEGGHAGFSYMRSDPESGAILLAAEDFLVYASKTANRRFHVGTPKHVIRKIEAEDVAVREELEAAKDRLKYLLKNNGISTRVRGVLVDLLDSEDNTGCSSDLTVVSMAPIKKIREIVYPK